VVGGPGIGISAHLRRGGLRLFVLLRVENVSLHLGTIPQGSLATLGWFVFKILKRLGLVALYAETVLSRQ